MEKGEHYEVQWNKKENWKDTSDKFISVLARDAQGYKKSNAQNCL